MSQKYFSETFDPITVEWYFSSETSAFNVKISLIGIGTLYSGLLHKGNSQVPFSFGKTADYEDILKGELKFITDGGQPTLKMDLKCDTYKINKSNYLLSSQDSSFTDEIFEESEVEKQINFQELVEPSDPDKQVDFLEIVEPIELIKPSNSIENVDAIALTPETVFVNSGEHQDLFPFIYLHTWSEIKPDELQKRFVKYDPTKVPDIIKYGKDRNAGYLYEELVNLKNQTDIENEGKSFINEGTAKSGKSYQGQFLQSLNDLQGYIKFFALLYTWLRHQRCIDLATIKFHIKKVLHINCWMELKKYVKGQIRYLPELIEKNITANTEGAITEYMIAKNRVWQNYFALTIIPEYRPHLLEELTKTLMMCHLIEKIAEDDEHCHQGSRIITIEEILEAARATIILPAEIFPLPSASPGETKTTEWIEPYAIGDLQMVRQRLLRYELGEVAYIENVLKGEHKETTQRKLNRVNQSVTNSSEQLEEIEDDIQGTRADILNEIQKTLAQDAVTTTFNNLSTEYGTTPSFAKVTGGWTISHAPDSTKPYKEDVKKFAKDITTRTANRIARYVNQVRTFSIFDEAEETVIHAFDNKNNTTNVIGIYRWVNQIYTAHVVNYGHRLMLEFMLENPADSYIKNSLQLQGISLYKPIAPDKLNPPIDSYKAITEDNYANLAIKYQVKDIQPPPDEKKIVTAWFKDGEPSNIKEIQIPKGYKALSAKVVGVSSGSSDQANIELTGFIGTQNFSLPTSDSQSEPIKLNNEDTAIAASVMCKSEQNQSDAKYSVSIEVECTLEEKKLVEWQIKTYNTILEGYRQQQAEYYEKAGVGQAEINSQNPLKSRQIEKHELKKACTRQLLQQHLQLVGSSDDNSVNNQSSKFAVNEPRYMQFFEQALEWNEMTYHFYAKLAEDQDKFAFTALNPYSGNDALFTSFLQAGAARVLVPVRPDYAMLVLYYLSSGMIWPGENPLTPTNDKYVSLVNELKILPKIDRECNHVSKPWEISIPTSMIMLQDSSKLPQFPVVL